MGPRVGKDQLQALVDIIARYADGATLDDIARALDAPPEQRKLQRWVNMIVEGGHATEDNTGPVTRYHVAAAAADTTHTTAVTPRAPTGRPPPSTPDSPSADLDGRNQIDSGQPVDLSTFNQPTAPAAVDPKFRS